jgi:riboflavin kinase/FMN adenylyltransferase
MKIIRQMSDMRRVRRPISLAVGFFDGLHTGHQEVLRRTMARARAQGGEAWAMTFDPHPLKILQPDNAPPILTSTPHKLDLMRRFGLDGCILIPFTHAFAATPARVFLARLGAYLPTLGNIFVGEDWHFGRGGEGDTRLLTAWARARGIRINRVDLVRRQAGLVVSSTRIRKAVFEGELALATRLLGRPFSILGSVVRGQGIGRQLGFPTANLDPHNEVSPPPGIYAVRAIVNRRAYAGVVSYGRHPTIRPLREPLLELHLLDTRRNLYGGRIEVFFLAWLRHERKFGSRDALVRRIGRDVALARRRLDAPRERKLWNSALQAWHPDTIVPAKKKE